MTRSADAPLPTVVSVFDLNPKKLGSMEEYAIFLSRELAARGCRSVLVFARPAAKEILPYLEGTGATLETFWADGKVGQYWRLTRILRKYNAEVVHFHFFEYYSSLPFWACLIHPKLLIITDHWRQPAAVSLRTRILCTFWDRVLFRFLDARFLAVSEHVKRSLIKCFFMTPGRIRVVLNGVNEGRFLPCDAEQRAEFRKGFGVPSGAPLVVTVAALIPQKGVDELLKAAELVLEKKPETVFLIAGEGILSDQLRRQAKEMGIAANVQFIGLRSDVERLMAAADVVAVPSVWEEPAGLVAVEAMACGRPVVAHRVGGLPEYVQDGVTGILVEPRAPEQFAGAILRLLDSAPQAAALGSAGRASVGKRFTMERWIGDTMRIYQETLGLGNEAK